ncbi:MAG TPA: hypothetical protein PKK96_06205 [Anaerolineales bacterium]|nr:hypothetical protein [Anaerolineales bacterium]HNQ94037.1 hypothetical protein [Anaerolineales bacterium]HNS60579.1 hypothetical protein [Anaerolineales bacterium]
MRNKFFPSVVEILFVVAFLLALASGSQALSIDSDLGRHLTLGNYILDNRVIPTRDLFSHTLSGESRPPYEWLSQVAFAISYRLLGLDGVILLTALIVGAAIAIVFHQSARRSKSLLVSLIIVLLATGATSIHWLPRPHIVTFLLLAIWVDGLEKIRKADNVNLLIFPALMMLWANLHGGFIFGFLALAAYFAGWAWNRWKKQATNEAGKKYLLIGFASLIASILTPDLWRGWEAVLNNRSAFILNRTVETMPLNLSDPSTAPFIILLALSVIFFFTNRRTASVSHIFLLGGFSVLAIMMTRNIPLFAIVSAPVLAEWIAAPANQLPAWKRFDERFINLAAPSQSFILPTLTAILAIGFFAYNHSLNKQIYQFNPQVFPVGAVDWLGENPPEGNMFNEFNWGGYLLYRLWPREFVFVDSQSDFYGEPLMRDYETILLAKNNWRDLLEKYQINWAIIPANTPLVDQLKQESSWIVLYEDPVAVIVQHK